MWLDRFAAPSRLESNLTKVPPALYSPSGMRKSCDIYVYIDAAKAMAAGIKFFRSANGVILTPGDENGLVAPSLFDKVLTSDGKTLSGGST